MIFYASEYIIQQSFCYGFKDIIFTIKFEPTKELSFETWKLIDYYCLPFQNKIRYIFIEFVKA